MAGSFEILNAGTNTFRFRLTADDGTVVAVSPQFPNLKAVVAGINAVRENAETGFVVDRCNLATCGFPETPQILLAAFLIFNTAANCFSALLFLGR